jgi:hypothetical protein
MVLASTATIHETYLLQAQLVAQLTQDTLSSQELAHNSRAKAKHAEAGDEDLIVGCETDLEACQGCLALLLLVRGFLGELQGEVDRWVVDSKAATVSGNHRDAGREHKPSSPSTPMNAHASAKKVTCAHACILGGGISEL